jgi:hypothetical protein
MHAPADTHTNISVWKPTLQPDIVLGVWVGQMLNYLGALDDDGAMTDVGRMMADFPLDPQLSRVLLAAPEYNCSNEALTVVSMLSVPNWCVRVARGYPCTRTH